MVALLGLQVCCAALKNLGVIKIDQNDKIENRAGLLGWLALDSLLS